MTDLNRFREYLVERDKVVGGARKLVGALAEKYSTYFSEVDAAFEREMGQITAALTGNVDTVPRWFRDAVVAAVRTEEERFDAKVAELEAAHDTARTAAEEARKRSVAEEEAARKKNVSLDEAEEALKTKSADLMARIEEHNATIREMGKGFGFFKNLPRMRSLRKEARELEEEQESIVQQIEGVRARWSTIDVEHQNREASARAKWLAARTNATRIQCQIDCLRQTREEVVLRSAMEQVLSAHVKAPAAPGPADPQCPRCKVRNPPNSSFCRICAVRLREDRPDAEGSLVEVAEVLHHHERFGGGMKAAQELIGLLTGVRSGIKAFMKSVDDMITTQRVHPVKELKIEVPKAARSAAGIYDTLARELSADKSMEPERFERLVAPYLREHLTEKGIQGWFETMGAELSRCATAQW